MCYTQSTPFRIENAFLQAWFFAPPIFCLNRIVLSTERCLFHEAEILGQDKGTKGEMMACVRKSCVIVGVAVFFVSTLLPISLSSMLIVWASAAENFEKDETSLISYSLSSVTFTITRLEFLRFQSPFVPLIF